MKWKESKFKGEYICSAGNFQFIACGYCYDISYHDKKKMIIELESGSVKTLTAAKKKCEDWLRKTKKDLTAKEKGDAR